MNINILTTYRMPNQSFAFINSAGVSIKAQGTSMVEMLRVINDPRKSLASNFSNGL